MHLHLLSPFLLVTRTSQKIAYSTSYPGFRGILGITASCFFPYSFYTGLQHKVQMREGGKWQNLEHTTELNDGIVSHFDVRPHIYTPCTGIDLALPTWPRKAVRASSHAEPPCQSWSPSDDSSSASSSHWINFWSRWFLRSCFPLSDVSRKENQLRITSSSRISSW